jgi:hypothetical protein
MPYSNWNQIPAIMHEVCRLQPQNVVDLGIGYGKYGTLLREVLDGMHGRCRVEQWQHRIIGFEAFEAYRNPCWGAYDVVHICDFASPEYHPVTGSDLVLMIDSLEHLEPEQGREFLARLVKENKHVIVSVPIQHMPQGAVYGNDYETHRTHHTGKEFDGYSPKVLHRDMCLTVSIEGRG